MTSTPTPDSRTPSPDFDPTHRGLSSPSFRHICLSVSFTSAGVTHRPSPRRRRDSRSVSGQGGRWT